MKLFCDYVKETADAETISTEDGFLVYQILKKELYIREYYVAPEKRCAQTHIYFSTEIHRIGKEAGCTYMSCGVDLNNKLAEKALAFHLKNGFKLHSVSESSNRIVLIKELE